MKNSGKNKGEYGYRTSHRKMQLGMVAFGIIMILIQLGACGLTGNQSVKNILTVMAVLSVLPTANVASPLLAAWRFKTPSAEFYSRVHVYEEHFSILYELIITSKEAIMPMDAVIVHPTGIYCYCTSVRADAKKGEDYLNGMLSAHRLDPDCKIIKDEKTFFQRLESLKPFSEYEDDGSVEHAAELLKQLSM